MGGSVRLVRFIAIIGAGSARGWSRRFPLRSGAFAGRSRTRLGLGRGKLHTVELAVAIRIGRLEPVGPAHGPFLESQQVVAVDVELAEGGDAGRQHFDAGDPAIAIAVQAVEAPLLLRRFARLGQRWT